MVQTTPSWGEYLIFMPTISINKESFGRNLFEYIVLLGYSRMM